MDVNTHRISIIEDSEIHVEWLKNSLALNAKFNVVSVDDLGRNGIQSVKSTNPCLVILDFQLKDITGMEVARWIKANNPDIKIFLLTAHTEISIIERLINDKNIDAIAIKGSHYFEDNFLLAITDVIADGTYLDPSLLRKLREADSASGLGKLTKREFEVFVQVNSGKLDQAIAEDLSVELAHIRNLKSRIASKIRHVNVDNLLSKLIENANPDVVLESTIPQA